MEFSSMLDPPPPVEEVESEAHPAFASLLAPAHRRTNELDDAEVRAQRAEAILSRGKSVPDAQAQDLLYGEFVPEQHGWPESSYSTMGVPADSVPNETNFYGLGPSVDGQPRPQHFEQHQQQPWDNPMRPPVGDPSMPQPTQPRQTFDGTRAAWNSGPQGYDPLRPQGFDPLRPQGYDPLRPQGFDPLRPQGYDPLRPQGYDPLRQGFDPLRQQGFDPMRQQGWPGQHGFGGPSMDMPFLHDGWAEQLRQQQLREHERYQQMRMDENLRQYNPNLDMSKFVMDQKQLLQLDQEAAKRRKTNAAAVENYLHWAADTLVSMNKMLRMTDLKLDKLDETLTEDIKNGEYAVQIEAMSEQMGDTIFANPATQSLATFWRTIKKAHEKAVSKEELDAVAAKMSRPEETLEKLRQLNRARNHMADLARKGAASQSSVPALPRASVAVAGDEELQLPSSPPPPRRSGS